jgi:Protein of unknown function (DUF2934)
MPSKKPAAPKKSSTTASTKRAASAAAPRTRATATAAPRKRTNSVSASATRKSSTTHTEHAASHHDIAQRAHDLYVQSGFQGQREVEFWLEAERQLRKGIKL